MKLISLTSNKASFHSISFNPSGLSLIVGKQKNHDKSNAQGTYNGVGKSLVIALIHFCLGSKESQEFEEKLPGWEFTLEYEIDGKTYISARSTSHQNKITLNGQEITLTKFRSEMESLVFNLPIAIPSLSFRALIKRFARSGKESYLSAEKIIQSAKPYDDLLACAFLLGLDIDLVTQKHKLKTDQDYIVKIRTSLKKDPIFKEYFVGSKNSDLELRDIEDEISRLENDLKVFQVAENYYQIEKEANTTKQQLQDLKNGAVLIENSISNINSSLKLSPDISAEKIRKLFGESKAKLPDLVIHEMSEVEAFHNKLAETRITRLSNEKIKLERALEEKNKQIKALAKKLDSQIKYLGTYRALDELIELSNHVTSLKASAQKIYDYRNILERYEAETREIKISIINENKRTADYIKDNQKLIDRNLDNFRMIAKRFYSDKTVGLTIENNEGNNQIRFDIKPRIQDDTSDGINGVKIFCFDMTILLGKHNHRVEFLFHDSRLYSDMDPRQRTVLFKIANEYSLQNGLQYIASVNEDQILTLKDQISESEYADIIEKNVVLGLTDESDTSKLLGIQVDLEYD